MKFYQATIRAGLLASSLSAFAQTRDLPPIAVPPPKVGDDIGTQPQRVDPKIVNPGLKSISPKPAENTRIYKDRYFCSKKSAAEALELCQKWTIKYGGACESADPDKTCAFRSKLLAGGSGL